MVRKFDVLHFSILCLSSLLGSLARLGEQNVCQDIIKKFIRPLHTGSVTFSCRLEEDCGSFDDRLAGMFGAAAIALSTGRKLRIHWTQLNAHFASTNTHVNIDDASPMSELASNTMQLHYRNVEWKLPLSEIPPSDTPIYFDSNRGLLNESYRHLIEQQYPSWSTLSHKQWYQCIWWNLFRPTNSLLNQNIHFISDSEASDRRLGEMTQYLDSPEVYSVGVHISVPMVLKNVASAGTQLPYTKQFLREIKVFLTHLRVFPRRVVLVVATNSEDRLGLFVEMKAQLGNLVRDIWVIDDQERSVTSSNKPDVDKYISWPEWLLLTHTDTGLNSWKGTAKAGYVSSPAILRRGDMSKMSEVTRRHNNMVDKEVKEEEFDYTVEICANRFC
jgi:hypothetical protein